MQRENVLSACSAIAIRQQSAADGGTVCSNDSKPIEGPDHVGSNHEESDKGCVGTSDLCSNGHSTAGEVIEQSLHSRRRVCTHCLIERASKQAHDWIWGQYYCEQSTAGISIQH